MKKNTFSDSGPKKGNLGYISFNNFIKNIISNKQKQKKSIRNDDFSKVVIHMAMSIEYSNKFAFLEIDSL